MSMIDWRNFDKELRLKYADKFESCMLNHGVMVHELLEKGPFTDTVRCPDCDKILIQAPDIAQALNDWRKLNSNPRTWATFEALQFEHERVVRVDTGTIHTNGMHERAICTITYTLNKDGSVHAYKQAHA